MFDIKSALSRLPEANDTLAIQQWGVRAMLHKSNQTLVLTMPTGNCAFHLGDQKLITIEMIQGSVKVGGKEASYYLTAGADVDALFALPSAYKIMALTDTKLRILARHPRLARSFADEEEYRRWFKGFK